MTGQTVLEQLRQMTIVVADTGDLSAIEQFRPRDATTNPSLITAAAALPATQPLIARAVADVLARYSQQPNVLEKQSVQKQLSEKQPAVEAVIDLLTVRLGISILELVEGRVSTEVDASLSFDTEATLAKARELIQSYQQAGIDTRRVLIKIASTWQGIQAARQLEAEGIACNLTLLFGLHQASACAEAGVTLISPFVGRILDWQKKNENRQEIPIDEDDGVQSVKRIYHYYKQHGYRTEIMGASFRSAEQIMALAGCDLLTIAPALLKELQEKQEPLTRQLSPDAISNELEKSILTQTQFDAWHQADRMSHELLDAGIKGFIKAREQLAETLISQFPELKAE